MSSNYELKLKFDKEATKTIDRFASKFQETRGSIVSKCIDVGEKIINEMLSGNDVIVKRKDGQTVEYTFRS